MPGMCNITTQHMSRNVTFSVGFWRGMLMQPKILPNFMTMKSLLNIWFHAVKFTRNPTRFVGFQIMKSLQNVILKLTAKWKGDTYIYAQMGWIYNMVYNITSSTCELVVLTKPPEIRLKCSRLKACRIWAWEPWHSLKFWPFGLLLFSLYIHLSQKPGHLCSSPREIFHEENRSTIFLSTFLTWHEGWY